MKYIHLGVCICIFLFVHNQILRADETVSDDSLYTAGYINSIYIAQPKRALQLLDEAENRKAIPLRIINELRSLSYSNMYMNWRLCIRKNLFSRFISLKKIKASIKK